MDSLRDRLWFFRTCCASPAAPLGDFCADSLRYRLWFFRTCCASLAAPLGDFCADSLRDRLWFFRTCCASPAAPLSNFSDATARHAVAREFGLNHHKFLRSWLECLAVLRNCCAHHSRLSNRVKGNDVDDTSESLYQHIFQQGLGDVKETVQADIQHPAPFILCLHPGR